MKKAIEPEVRKSYREHAIRYAARFGEGDKFWQPKYYSFLIYGRGKLEEKLEYMHKNPFEQDS